MVRPYGNYKAPCGKYVFLRREILFLEPFARLQLNVISYGGLKFWSHVRKSFLFMIRSP